MTPDASFAQAKVATSTPPGRSAWSRTDSQGLRLSRRPRSLSRRRPRRKRMALTDFGVMVDDVLEKLPLDTSQVSATTEPLSTVDIMGFIQDASSSLVGLMR